MTDAPDDIRDLCTRAGLVGNLRFRPHCHNGEWGGLYFHAGFTYWVSAKSLAAICTPSAERVESVCITFPPLEIEL